MSAKRLKHKVSNIILIICALVVFMIGSGATIVDFCCNDCFDKFLTKTEIFSEPDTSHIHGKSCCGSHKKEEQKPDKCDSHSENGQCCKMGRKSITLDSYHFKPVIFASFHWIPTTFIQQSKIQLPNHTNGIQSFFESTSPPKITDPRTYLSILNTLLI